MRELINNSGNRAAIRRKLLTGVSAVALAACISSSGAAGADADRPSIWLEASGQFDQLDDSQSIWLPEFVPGYTTGPLAGQYTSIQRRPKTGFDADASILFQPHGSDWMARASVRIGKARQPGSVLVTEHNSGFGRGKYSTHYDGSSHSNESHQIVDFQAGKDVGLGWSGSSVMSAGVRIADLRSRSDIHVGTEVPVSSQGTAFNDVTSRTARKFTGVGPSIAWDASVPVAGTMEDGELAVDWNLNAALLFGRQTMRQKIHASYQGNYRPASSYNVQVRQETHSTRLRRKNVTVPDLGASIGISYRWPAARLSLGYRADIFFNALDGGVAASEKVNRGFFGPFASMSIGLGD